VTAGFIDPGPDPSHAPKGDCDTLPTSAGCYTLRDRSRAIRNMAHACRDACCSSFGSGPLSRASWEEESFEMKGVQL
jgi:hypothetical protein